MGAQTALDFPDSRHRFYNMPRFYSPHGPFDCLGGRKVGGGRGGFSFFFLFFAPKELEIFIDCSSENQGISLSAVPRRGLFYTAFISKLGPPIIAPPGLRNKRCQTAAFVLFWLLYTAITLIALCFPANGVLRLQSTSSSLSLPDSLLLVSSHFSSLFFFFFPLIPLIFRICWVSMSISHLALNNVFIRFQTKLRDKQM